MLREIRISFRGYRSLLLVIHSDAIEPPRSDREINLCDSDTSANLGAINSPREVVLGQAWVLIRQVMVIKKLFKHHSSEHPISECDGIERLTPGVAITSLDHICTQSLIYDDDGMKGQHSREVTPLNTCLVWFDLTHLVEKLMI